MTKSGRRNMEQTLELNSLQSVLAAVNGICAAQVDQKVEMRLSTEGTGVDLKLHLLLRGVHSFLLNE